MQRHIAAAVLLAGCGSAPQTGEVHAWTPVSLGLTRDYQLSDQSTDVYGLRFDLVSGSNHRMVGIDVNGWWGCTDAGSGGLAIALGGNEAGGSFIGLQIAGGFNFLQPLWGDERTIYGAQFALLANSGDLWGAQVGLLNGWPSTHDTRGDTIRGVQLGLFDGAGKMCGVQLAGLLTWTEDVYGVQLAPINICERAHGLQLGLFNRVRSGGLQIGLLNWNDNGLLPLLPLFNIGFE